MSEITQENNTPARPVKLKSNAPWVLGIIALMLAIPNLMCQMLCKEAVTKLDKISTETKEVREVLSNSNEVVKNDIKALGAVAETLDAVSKGDTSSALDSGKKSLEASVDTMKASADTMDKMSKQTDQKDKAAKSKKSATSDDSKSSNDKAMEAFDDFMKGSVILCIVMFILSFFGKSKLSAITGGLIVLGALALSAWSLCFVQVLGCIEGLLFLFSGIFSITNLKKVK